MADLDHPVTYVAQSQPMSCWAASAAMMMNTTEAEILEQFADFGDDGANEPECQALAQRLQMNILPEACRNADGWWQILGRGPVMVGIPTTSSSSAASTPTMPGTPRCTCTTRRGATTGRRWRPWKADTKPTGSSATTFCNAELAGRVS